MNHPLKNLNDEISVAQIKAAGTKGEAFTTTKTFITQYFCLMENTKKCGSNNSIQIRMNI